MRLRTLKIRKRVGASTRAMDPLCTVEKGPPRLRSWIAHERKLCKMEGLWKMRTRQNPASTATLTDYLMLQTHLLEASLIGIAIFLFMIVCQLHAQLCEIAFLRKKLEALKKHAADSNEDLSGIHLKLTQQCGLGREEELVCHKKTDSLESMVLDLKKKIENLQVDSLRKDEEIRAAEANAKALQKQSEGFLLEYDRLLEDNQSLRSQLSSVDRRLHH